MAMVDPFTPNAFSLTSLTAAINNLKYAPGRLGELGLFEEAGVNTLSVGIEERDGVLSLAEIRPRGAPGAPVHGEARRNLVEAKEIHDVIRYFGSRKKVFNVHFRNIRGKRDDFVETYPDEGDVDFVEAIRTWREVDYEYMLMPDHVPHHPDDPRGDQAFAFCYGYIRALIQASDRLI